MRSSIPLPRAALRLIVVEDKNKAETVRKRLAEGASFETLARDPKLNMQSSGGGLMADIPGDQVFGSDKLNQAMLGLKEGEYAGPIEVAGLYRFVKVEKLKRPKSQSLTEAQCTD